MPQEQFEVRKILYPVKRDGRLKYQVFWEGYEDEDATFEDMENLLDCPEAVLQCLTKKIESSKKMILRCEKEIEEFNKLRDERERNNKPNFSSGFYKLFSHYKRKAAAVPVKKKASKEPKKEKETLPKEEDPNVICNIIGNDMHKFRDILG